MIDPNTVLNTLAASTAAISSMINNIKSIRDNKSLDETAKQQLQVADFMMALADTKANLADFKNAFIEKNQELIDLERQIEIDSQMAFDHCYYWQTKNGGSREGPFCQCCYDKDKKLIRLQPITEGLWDCKVCKNNFEDRNYVATVGSTIDEEELGLGFS